MAARRGRDIPRLSLSRPRELRNVNTSQVSATFEFFIFARIIKKRTSVIKDTPINRVTHSDLEKCN